MIPTSIKNTVRENFREEIDDGQKNVYFNQLHSSRDLSLESISELFRENLGFTECVIEEHNSDGFVVKLNDSPVFIWSIGEERWLFVYSTSLDRKFRTSINKLGNKVGWLLDVWIPGKTIDELFHEFSPDQESVNIERTWDPYWVYERDGEIPENLQRYYNENYEDFVEQEIELSLKTPKALVDETLSKGVRDDLLEKSETSESKFTFQPTEERILQDGGLQIESGGPQSRVKVKQEGQVVHSTGEASATFELMEEIEDRTTYYEKFESAVPKREYSKREDGSLELEAYSPGKVIKFTFEAEHYNQELSIKLSNFFTVGQSDVEIHGTERHRNKLEFFATAYTTYDEGEYEVYFTEEKSTPVLFVKPLSAETSGVLYLFQKLKEKIDPRIDVELASRFPHMEV